MFQAVRDFAYATAGIDLQDGKQEMVASRLWKRARALGFSTVEQYFEAVRSDTDGDLYSDLIDALTTNHTSFFREPAHFEFLKSTVLPRISRREGCTIWCGASSTGEEPYSLATTILDTLGPGYCENIRIRATDISHRVLRVAEKGIYPEERFRGLSQDWRSRYLLRGKGEHAGFFRFRPEVRRMIQFSHLNLMEPLPSDGPFPLISLRNVMIYFDRPTQEKVVKAVSAKLEPGGHLFIGHSESLNGIAHNLNLIQVAIYQRPDFKTSAERSR
jgi:chemotaxis protein methyltransferase CheR